MLTIQTSDAYSTRRHFLTAGSLALGGFSLSSLFTAREAGAKPAASTSLDTGKSVIFLFQQGGPSQFETFDPKPDAPQEIRTVGGLTKTALPGVYFGDTMQKLAKLADKFTVVRSFATGNGGHNIQPIVGPDSLNTNLGSLYSSVVGATHPATSVPTNAVVFPQAVCNDVTKGQGRGDFAATGSVGAAFAPFIPGEGGNLQKDLRLNLTRERFQDRRALLAAFDQLREETNADTNLKDFDRGQRQACEVLLSGSVADALDLTREDPGILAKYDTAQHVAPHDWNRAARGKRGYYTGHAKALGKSLLLARRLCEAGCGFVTVHTGYEGVWDMHADGNNLNMKDGMEAVGRSFDHAVAAFIEDLEARGLSDKIMLVATGEMGRTPRLNKNGGRDHWAKLAPLLLYGGGVAQGKVIGRSTRDGGEADAESVGTPNLISTILHTTFDMGLVRLKPALGAISRLGEAKPIPGVF
ncbi:MAG: DUF1501 domain-containing protein [Planctomycetes bacterium]|nr:DUF1501 domain-containing protein [Planctomycetota bacterium]